MHTLSENISWAEPHGATGCQASRGRAWRGPVTRALSLLSSVDGGRDRSSSRTNRPDRMLMARSRPSRQESAFCEPLGAAYRLTDRMPCLHQGRVEDLLGMLTDPDPLVNSLEPPNHMFPPLTQPPPIRGISVAASRHDEDRDLDLAVVDHLGVPWPPRARSRGGPGRRIRRTEAPSRFRRSAAPIRGR
jgi:hypothetical protein